MQQKRKRKSDIISPSRPQENEIKIVLSHQPNRETVSSARGKEHKIHAVARH